MHEIYLIMGIFDKLLGVEDTDILEKLLEYEDPSLQGIPLSKQEDADHYPTDSHHRYHKTRAGLYVVLRHHKNRTFQKHEYSEGSASISLGSMSGEDGSLPDLFTFKSDFSHFNATFNKSVTKSNTHHHSGIRVAHVTDSLEGTILSVELSGWTKCEEADVPAWRLRIQRNLSGTPYRSNALPVVEAAIFSYQKHALEPDGRVTTALPAFEGKHLDYESSAEQILNLMVLYFVSRNRENYAKHLNSPNCLVFQ